MNRMNPILWRCQMNLSYQDIFEQDAKRTRIKASITTEHPGSSYGQPVIVINLSEGGNHDKTRL